MVWRENSKVTCKNNNPTGFTQKHVHQFTKVLMYQFVVDSFVGRKYERRRKKGAGAGTAPALQDGAQQPHGSSTSGPSNVWSGHVILIRELILFN